LKNIAQFKAIYDWL